MIPVSSPNDAYNKLSVPLKMIMMIRREMLNLVRLLFCTHNSSYDVSNFKLNYISLISLFHDLLYV